MTDQERLQLIIETALKHGWNGYTYYAILLSSYNDSKVPVSVRMDEQQPKSIVELLYGDKLSLLKAACGSEAVKTTLFYVPDQEVTHIFEDLSVIPQYQLVAQESVLLPDNERLAFITEHLRKD